MRTYVLPVIVLLSILAPAVAQESSAEAMRTAARNLLDALDEGQRETILHAFDSEERFDWHYVPKPDRKGLSLKQMEPDEVQLAHVLLVTSLSRTGYAKTVTVMSLEQVLRELETAAGSTRAAEVRDPTKYHVTLFGEPSAGETWGWSLEGHHVSLNFTVIDGEVVASSPAFLGANPHTVPSGPRQGLRVLGAEEDRARALLDALDEGQRAIAILSDTPPRDILTGAEPRISPQKPQGLPASSMSAEQRSLLHALIEEYARNVPEDLARERREQLEAAGDSIHFAWMGSTAPGQAHYYRVQTPSFLIEYDNRQNDANHSHTVWRDFEGDFGRDLLAEHYREHEH